MTEEADADFEAFLEAIDRALTQLYGPDHQRVLGEIGMVVHRFEWSENATAH